MNNFFKDNRKVSSQIIQQMAIEAPKALSLWLGLKNIANGYGICVASQTALAELLHSKSRTTVYYAVKYLSDKGYIKVGKIGNQNAYILNPNIVQRLPYDSCKDTLTNHGIVFSGTIELTREENPKLYKEFRKFIKENPSPSMGAINRLRIKGAKPKRKSKHMKIYKSKSAAKRHNGYYQPSMIKFTNQKSQRIKN